jgi:hypothetical protein
MATARNISWTVWPDAEFEPRYVTSTPTVSRNDVKSQKSFARLQNNVARYLLPGYKATVSMETSVEQLVLRALATRSFVFSLVDEAPVCTATQ